MAKSKPSPTKHAAALRRFAMSLPQVEEGVSCNKAAFQARGKAFLFVGSGDAATNTMLKLKDSLPEAAKLAAGHPTTYQIGGHGWVTITLPHSMTPPTKVLKVWIEESYRLLAPKKLSATLDGRTESTRK